VTASTFGTLASHAGAAPISQPVRTTDRSGGARETSPPAVAVASAPNLRSAHSSSAGAAPDERREFIRRSLKNRYMDESIKRMPPGLILCLAMTAVCLPVVPASDVLAWTSVVLLGDFVRLVAEMRFTHTLRDAPGAVQAEFLDGITPIYLVLAISWGCSPLLFVERMDELRAFACWLIVAAMMYVPQPRMALVPKLGRRFTSVFFVTALSCILYSSWKSGAPREAFVWMMALCAGQWALTCRMTADMYRTQSEHYGLIYDLEAQKREALAAVQAKNRFLAAATHDMRQPVIALSLYAEYLEEYPETNLELAPKIKRASDAVNSLFNSLFDLSKLDAGDVPLSVVPVRICEILNNMFTTAEPVARAAGIELRLRVTDTLLQTDAMRLRRMIENVLSNAIKYSRPGGKILLAARVRHGKLHVEVWDQGIGIPAEKISQVFTEFYRGDAALKLAPDGMGIGLSLVARLAEALNTKITIASVEGRGTRVTMEIGDLDPEQKARTLAFDGG
jgi:signal transduction histidine kinase